MIPDNHFRIYFVGTSKLLAEQNQTDTFKKKLIDLLPTGIQEGEIEVLNLDSALETIHSLKLNPHEVQPGFVIDCLDLHDCVNQLVEHPGIAFLAARELSNTESLSEKSEVG